MQPGYSVRPLRDRASLWPLAEGELRGAGVAIEKRARGEKNSANGTVQIGLVGWCSASREEIAELTMLRDAHNGPIVALLAELPSARGARVLAARLEGSALASKLQRTLLPTLAAVAVGQCVVPRSVLAVLERPSLSPRERQILAMLVLDFSNAEIARKLFVTESNVKNHLTSAFQKLGVRSRNAAVELILDSESGLGPGILRISPEETLAGGGDIN